MSFLGNNNSESLSNRITKKGRNLIANGNFNVAYFQIGDSEFDYNTPFYTLTSGSDTQKVMSPFDKTNGVKYPYKIDSTTGSTTYGTPVLKSQTITLRNVVGPAGFVSNYTVSGSTIFCYTEAVDITLLNGTNTIDVSSGNEFQGADFVTISFNEFIGTDPDFPTTTGDTNSLIYKIINISGNTLTLDRNTPDLSSLTGYVQITRNKCEIEYPIQTEISPICSPLVINSDEQQNPWSLNVVWGEKPIGADVSSIDEDLIGYESNVFVSAKEHFGYTSTGQTFIDVSGITITNPTSYTNSFNEIINLEPRFQRTIAILHYSELGGIRTDSERFFKYDDYISTLNLTGDTIYTDYLSNNLTDQEYFEVYIPFFNYHRSGGIINGALFHMGDTDYLIRSTKNDGQTTKFRYLIDETDHKVGKIFVDNKIIIFDDQEIVAALDYRSNRRHTLDAPKVTLTPSDTTPETSLIELSGDTLWVTYMIADSDSVSSFNSLPCNYYSKVSGATTPSNVTVKFGSSSFKYMNATLEGFKDGYVGKKFYILAQIRGENNPSPYPSSWRIMDFTTEAGGDGSTYLNPANLTGTTFTITRDKYESGSIFDLETFLGSDYLSVSGSTFPQFGDNQTFPGSIRLIRSTDIEEMSYDINLPTTQFNVTQNPTWSSGKPLVITEAVLLDSNKNVLVTSKASSPILRNGSTVLNIRLDF